MKWIRWPGLIAFIVIVGLMAAFWLLLADLLLERAIESAGTAAIGARVELKGANISLSPLGITLIGLEVTSPDEPMINALETQRIAFLMDGQRLLLGKVLIEEMSAEGIRFDTDRKTSGAIDRKASQEKADVSGSRKDGSAAPEGFEVPDVDEILGREELETLKLADKVSADIKQKETAWDVRLKTLPDSKTLKEFESRYKEIERKFKGSTKDMLVAVKDASELQRDIKAARDMVKSAATDLEADYRNLAADINMALKSPERDLKRLKNKYQISARGAGNLSSLIFGPSVEQYISKANSAYSIAKPFLDTKNDKPPKPERKKGIDVRFREFNPAPAFWARSVKTQVILSSGPVEGTMSDLSSDQTITGRPTTINLSAKGLEKARSMVIKGSMDHRNPASPNDRLEIAIMGRTIDGLKLSGSGSLPVTINSGKSDTIVKASVRAGDRFNSTATVRVHSASIISDPSGEDKVARAMGRALSALKGFSVDVKANGTLSDYRISVKSDIDEALKTAVGGLLKEESLKFEASLRDAIKTRTSAPLSELKGKLKGLEGSKASLTSKSASLDSLLRDASGIKANKLLRF